MNNVTTCFTLIDVTATGVTKGLGEARDQQRNWESVVQLLGLRAQPFVNRTPVRWDDESLKYFEFGNFYEGHHTVWAFQFSGDREDSYLIEELDKDFDQIPIVLGLDETARFMLPLFHTQGFLKNIHFIQRPGINIV
jgi:hypothetical protein